MKKSNLDFTIPRRQAPAAIVLIIYKYYKFLLGQIFPLAIIFFIGGKATTASWEKWVIYGGSVISGFAAFFAIISYFKYYFHTEGDEMVVQKGILQKKRTTIPFERIQTVNLEQNLLHQLLKVHKVVIDTAGTSKNEFVFDALKKEEAEALKRYLLTKKEALQEEEIIQESVEQKSIIQEEKPILSVGIAKLLKIGITENHLKSGGLIMAFGYWIYENLSEIGFDLVDNYGNQVKEQSSFLFVLFIAGLFTIIAFFVSLFRTILTHYNLTFSRSKNGFSVRQGLLTKKFVSALDHKIQMLVFSDNILQKLLGYKNLYFKQASSSEVENKKSIKIPGCSTENISTVTGVLYDNNNLHFEAFRPVEKAYLIRGLMYLSLILAALSIVCYITKSAFMIWSVILGGLYVATLIILKYRKTSYSFNHKMIRINGGYFGDTATILPIYKIQSVKMSQSPYMRRNDLVTLVFYTASGSTSIPYIKLEIAQAIADYFLYRIESSKAKWM